MIGAPRRFSVPGTILVLGEYAVLEEGGLGIAVAVERRAYAAVAPGTSLLITSSWGGGTISWTPENPGTSRLLSACVAVVEEWLGAEKNQPIRWGTTISMDSSAFFAADGRKTGFGSSAAAAVAAVAALLMAAGVAVRQNMPLAHRLAVAAHRRAQGGVGSGYDVTTSLNGGTGVFHGGAFPTWETRALGSRPQLLTFAGANAVQTAPAVQRYGEWKCRNPEAAREFLADSNEAVKGFLGAPSPREAAPWFVKARRLGIALGDEIGVPAVIEPPVGLDPEWCKSLGAGNEMGVCLVWNTRQENGVGMAVEPVVTAREGLRWEE